jgi:hypothetical protein
MANTDFYRMALHDVTVRLILKQNGLQQTHTTNFNDHCTFTTYELPVFPNVLTANGVKNGPLARGL